MSEFLNRLRSTWDNFSPRERILVGAVGGLMLISVLFYGVILPVMDRVADHGELEAAEEQLRAMRRLNANYQEVNSRLAQVEAKIRSTRGDGNLRTLLGALARNSAVEITSMEERAVADSAEYKETRMEVDLQKVTLEQIVSYLHKIESSEQMLSIKSLRIKNRVDKSKLLDVSFTVSSFTPI